MKKKQFRFIALILTMMMMTLGLPTVAFGADTPSSWAQEEVTQAIELGIVPESLQGDYQANITRGEFCTLIMTLAGLFDETAVAEAAAKDNPFDDTDSEDVIAAYNMGIVNGKTATTFVPEGNIQRQEAAAMLTRAADAFGVDTTAEPAEFADSAKIASYAKDSVNFVFANDIMKGVSDTEFAPTANYTREQSYLTALRLYNTVNGPNPGDIINVPNPMVVYETLDEAKAAVEFTVMVPELSTLTAKEYAVINETIFQVTYADGDNEVVYRMAEGSADISGDYTVYDEVNTVQIASTNINTKGQDGVISNATWVLGKGEESFALLFGPAVDLAKLTSIIESIK